MLVALPHRCIIVVESFFCSIFIYVVPQRNQSLGFVAAITLMIGLVVWLFILMQLRRIALNTTANESFKRDDLYDTAELDGETTGRQLFSVLVQQLRRKVRKANMPRNARKKDLDSSWGGLFSADVILNTEERFSVSDVKYNPYDLGGFWSNLKDALQVKARQSDTSPSDAILKEKKSK